MPLLRPSSRTRRMLSSQNSMKASSICIHQKSTTSHRSTSHRGISVQMAPCGYVNPPRLSQPQQPQPVKVSRRLRIPPNLLDQTLLISYHPQISICTLTPSAPKTTPTPLGKPQPPIHHKKRKHSLFPIAFLGTSPTTFISCGIL